MLLATSTTKGGSLPASEQHCKQIMKLARKRQPKTLRDFADEMGVHFRALPVSVAKLVREGQLASDGGRPPKYTKV